MAASSSTIRIEPGETKSSRPEDMRLMVASGTDGLSHQGELHGEGRALSGRALDANFSGVLLDDAVSDRKPQPGAATVAGLGFVLGGEERIVDAGDVFLRDARAGVGDLYLHVVPVAGCDLECAAGGHGVFGVEEQVEENLLEFAGVAVDGR